MPAYKIKIPLLKGWTLTGFVEAPSPEVAKMAGVQEIKQLYPQFQGLKFLDSLITAEEVR